MGLPNFEVFNGFVQSAYTETLRENTELFNSASNNALRLVNKKNIGSFTDDAYYQSIADLVVDRDVNSTADVAIRDLAMIMETSVKIAGGTQAVRYTAASYDWTQRQVKEAASVFGEQLAVGSLNHKINRALASLVAAINGADVTYESSGIASIESLNLGAGKMGDRQGDIAAWIMHSKSMNDIYGMALANSNRLFNFGNVKVMQDGHGRPLIMVDSDALQLTVGDTTKYHQLGLVSGACMIEDNGDLRIREATLIKENTEDLIKAEWSFNLGLKGYAWNKAGGESPKAPALATTANWNRTATSHKDTAGVKVTTL